MNHPLQPVTDKLPELAMPFDPPADRRDPYGDYARCRRETPVVTTEKTPNMPALAWVYRYSDVAQVLQDHTRFSNDAAKVFLGPTLGEDLLVGMDPPEHANYRRLVSPAFSPAALTNWKHGLVKDCVTELLDAMDGRGKVDLVRDLAFILPAKIMSRMLGLPERDFETFRAWAMDIITVAGDPSTAFASADALRAYLDPIIAQRRRDPRNDVISRLVTAQVDREMLTHSQIQSFLLTLLPAGIETTYRSLGNLMLVLLARPGLWNSVVSDNRLIRPAIEEILRFEAPLQVVFRTALVDQELSGFPIVAGTYVIPVIGSANRDEDANTDPDNFDIGRSGRKYLTFGNGGHTCLGMHLAKLELAAAVEGLVQRFPGLTFDEERAREQDVHIRGLMVRSPASVPVILGR